MKKNRKLLIISGVLTSLYIGMKAVARKKSDPKSIDEDNPYIKEEKYNIGSQTFYERRMKPVLDQTLSFIGLLVLSPLFGLISLAIYMDDPGPVFFIQKRVGRDKHFFMLHKFRSMKKSTPHDTPTHALDNPDQYITKIGKILRRTSLDELPQVWDIFRGKMSVIGPRPALWNQEDLVKERQKYGANSPIPGLTGLAQIKGRDELEISDKAKLDGEYTAILRKGSWAAFKQDVSCFIGTVGSVLKHEGVVEGGTGELKKNAYYNDSVNEVYKRSTLACRKNKLDTNPIKVLIVGADSYIGTNVEAYLGSQGFYEIETLSTINLKTDPELFRGYDVVFHVAGIAHRKESKENEHIYYEVNRDLAIEVAKAAKAAGVLHFIILSSMSVYGKEIGHITKDTRINPKNHYGKSKAAADERIWGLRDEHFRVSILRPPMVYGKGCKGNYQRLRKLALITPVFPVVNNKRSMIYIGNLCEFVKQVIEEQKEGIFFPQNTEYVNTSELVRQIAFCNGKEIRGVKFLCSIINHVHTEITDKVFGSLTYEKTDMVSKFGFEESIIASEGSEQRVPKVVVVTSYTPSLFWYRLDMMCAFAKKGYEVFALGDQEPDAWEEKFSKYGIVYKQIYIRRNGMNPADDLRTLASILHELKEIRPTKIFSYQAKSTIYTGIAARMLRISEFYPMIGGVGSVFLSDTFKTKILRKIVVNEYKIALKKAAAVFFQNEDDEKTFRQYRIISRQKVVRIHGSGVNIKEFNLQPYPDKVAFLLTARLIRDKGIYEYLEACRKFKSIHKTGRCLLVGPFDSNPTALKKEELQPFIDEGIIEYFGEQEDIRPYLKQCSVFVLPSYREGTPKAILEAMSCGRAVITTDTVGCRETVQDGENGYLVPVKNIEMLFEKMAFLYEHPEKVKEMGKKGREMAEKVFDVDTVNDAICQTMKI